MGEITGAINSILSMNTASAIIKIVLVLLSAALAVYMAIKGKSVKVEAARSVEAKDEVKNHDLATSQNVTDNQQVISDSQRVDDFLKGSKK